MFDLFTQKWKLLDCTIRVNLTFVLCWKLRSTDERDQFLRDVGGKYGLDVTREIFEKCTDEKYSFLYYDALANDFYCRFEYKAVVREKPSQE